MILQTLLRAVQALIIGTMAGLMFLAATVLASLETVFTKKVRRKPI
jgi:nitrate reductase gamma subunit